MWGSGGRHGTLASGAALFPPVRISESGTATRGPNLEKTTGKKRKRSEVWPSCWDQLFAAPPPSLHVLFSILWFPKSVIIWLMLGAVNSCWGLTSARHCGASCWWPDLVPTPPGRNHGYSLSPWMRKVGGRWAAGSAPHHREVMPPGLLGTKGSGLSVLRRHI